MASFGRQIHNSLWSFQSSGIFEEFFVCLFLNICFRYSTEPVAHLSGRSNIWGVTGRSTEPGQLTPHLVVPKQGDLPKEKTGTISGLLYHFYKVLGLYFNGMIQEGTFIRGTGLWYSMYYLVTVCITLISLHCFYSHEIPFSAFLTYHVSYSMLCFRKSPY